MIRTLDASAFNEIIKHPDVRPLLGFADPSVEVDLTAVVGNIDNFAFLTPHGDGGYLLLKLQPGLYAAHTLALPTARGRPMIRLMREGFAAMFKASDAVEIITQIPDGNANAKALSDVAGFRDTFRRESFFPMNGELVGCQFRSLGYADWVMGDKANLAAGRELHEVLAESPGHVNHPEDSVHDHWVGATIGGCVEGNMAKAIGFYNRWASIAGYGTARILSTQPPVVDIGDAVIQLADGRIEILTRREAPSAQLEG